jgi:cell wall-associated NlpC family hydrolase
MKREHLMAYALAMIGKPYFWGGDDPVGGFDCSGLCSEILRASGVVPYKFRTNAQGILNLFRTGGFPVCEPGFGALAFYGKSPNEVDHIAFCIDEHTIIEAGGGDSSTVNAARASAQNAFVRMRPVKFRKDFLFCYMPAYPFKGEA